MVRCLPDLRARLESMPPDKLSFLQDLQSRLGELMKTTPAADIERNLRALLAQTFNRLELVNREEFDAYAEMLGTLRERVTRLEETVTALEAERAGKASGTAQAPPD